MKNYIDLTWSISKDKEEDISEQEHHDIADALIEFLEEKGYHVFGSSCIKDIDTSILKELDEEE